MAIVVHTTYTANIEIAVPCLVRCKNCGCQFVYERQFSGEGKAGTVMPFGHSRTERAAEARARDDLDRMLSHADVHDPIPCPQCFHYQPYMFSQVGYAHYDNMGCLCYSLIVSGLAVLVGAAGYAAIWKAAPLALGLAATGGGAWLAGWLVLRRMHELVRHYDPNEEGAIHDTLDERKHVAQARATRLPDYDARQAADAGRERERLRGSAAEAGQRNPLVVRWWLPPAAFINGEVVPIVLPGDERFTARVPSAADHGDVVDASPARPHAEPLRLRLLKMRVHPEE